jgi:hypothetical protein
VLRAVEPDRIVLNAYFRMGHDPGGFRSWWRALSGSDETLDNTDLMRMAGMFRSQTHALLGANSSDFLCLGGKGCAQLLDLD